MYTSNAAKSGWSSSTASWTSPLRNPAACCGSEITGTNAKSATSRAQRSGRPRRYRSAASRAPQYSVIGRRVPRCRKCSISALIGAKPVPPAISSIGRSLSSRGTKVPSGPSTRSSAPAFMSSNTPVVKPPPADVAHVQLDRVVVVRRIGDRERAALAVGQQHVEILAGQAAQALAARGQQDQAHDVRR